MSYDYGSNSIEIPNPFKKEGILFTVSGTICTLVGLISIFTLRGKILNHGLAIGWVNLVISILLLYVGIKYIVSGLFKVFRFYVGRGIPASLTKNLAPSEAHVQESEIAYRSNDLEQMLMGRKNPTFIEPRSIFDRFVYSIFPKFLFLPYPIRNYLHLLTQNTAYTIIFLVIYIFTIISGSVGLTKLTETSFTAWMGNFLAVMLLFIWKPSNFPGNKFKNLATETLNTNGLVWLTIGAILVPVFGEILLRSGVTFPEAPMNPVGYLVLVILLAIVTVSSGLIMAQERAEMFEPITEVSEHRDHWQENVHPKDIFRSFEMEMANHRYKEIPNRVYREMKPELNMEGSSDKGSFNGDTIQETQPIYQEIKYSDLYQQLRLYSSVYGNFLVVSASILLLLLNTNTSTNSLFVLIMKSFFIPAVLWFFGEISINIAHTCWAEINFKSILIHFQGEGTYTESKISVGMAITDSTRSENQVVRTSFTPWVIVSEIMTSTFAGVGTKNLEGARYVLDMRKSNQILEQVLKGIRDFLEGRQVIADTNSKNDLNSVVNYYQMNQASPANLGVKVVEKFLNRDQPEDKLEVK